MKDRECTEEDIQEFQQMAENLREDFNKLSGKMSSFSNTQQEQELYDSLFFILHSFFNDEEKLLLALTEGVDTLKRYSITLDDINKEISIAREERKQDDTLSQQNLPKSKEVANEDYYKDNPEYHSSD